MSALRCRQAPRCCDRRQGLGSHSRHEVSLRWVRDGACSALPCPAPYPRYDNASHPFPVHRYTILRLYSLLPSDGRRNTSTRLGWLAVYINSGSMAALGCPAWIGVHFNCVCGLARSWVMFCIAPWCGGVTAAMIWVRDHWWHRLSYVCMDLYDSICGVCVRSVIVSYDRS